MEEEKNDLDQQVDRNDNIKELIDEAEEHARDIEIISNVMVQTIPNPMGFRTLMEGMEQDLFVVPSFQRVYRWTEEQVEELAISLVRGMPIPPIYGYRNHKNQIVILDGQQRLISLYLYYRGKCLKRKRNGFISTKELTNRKQNISFCDAIEEWGLTHKEYKMKYYDINSETTKEVDISYKNLSSEARRVVDFAQLNIILIGVDSAKYKERTIYKIFANLNKGGIPLSAQELRNGIYTCPFYDMLHEINEDERWRAVYSKNKESKDVELLLKLCAFRRNVIMKNNEFRLQNYKGKITLLLDEFSEEALRFGETEISEYKNALGRFFDCIIDISNDNKETLWPCLFVAAERKDFNIQITKELCNTITNSKEYKETNKSGTASKADIENRLRCVYEQI